MDYQKQIWSPSIAAKSKRSSTSQRLAVESLVAVANTSKPTATVVKQRSSGSFSQKSLPDVAVRTVFLKYLKDKHNHRATVSEVAKIINLTSEEVADFLLAANAEGLVKLKKGAVETEAMLVE